VTALEELEGAGRDPGATDAGQALYAYGVVRAGTVGALSTVGIGGGEVGTIVSGGLAALAGTVTTPIRAKRRELLAHADVLNEAARATTVLPLRFGMMFPDADAVVHELLDGRRERLERLLDELDGKVELLVKAFYRDEVVLTEIVAGDPGIARLSAATRARPAAATHAQRLELGTAVARALESRTRADAAAILRELTPLAVDVRIDETPVEHQVLRASLLVERDRVDEIDAVVSSIAEAQAGRMGFKYAGPLAPHSFVDLEGSQWAS
jgi:Gas vesicle synthesis protein GvpL/GvpF